MGRGGSGWLELGRDEWRQSLVRVLDGGGMIWESDASVTSLTDALALAEAALVAWMQEQCGDR